LAFGITFRVTGGYRKTRTYFLKGLLKGILRLISDFIEANKSFDQDFLPKKQPKIVKKTVLIQKVMF
jgi:hypothetical protein